MLPYNKHLKSKARELRTRLTHSERALWERLRGKQLLDVQFYRQKPIGDYIVDFYAPKANLVIEVDGSQHFIGDHVELDKQRDECLANVGLKVLRFNSREVLTNTDDVVEVIHRTTEAQALAGGRGDFPVYASFSPPARPSPASGSNRFRFTMPLSNAPPAGRAGMELIPRPWAANGFCGCSAIPSWAGCKTAGGSTPG